MRERTKKEGKDEYSQHNFCKYKDLKSKSHIIHTIYYFLYMLFNQIDASKDLEREDLLRICGCLKKGTPSGEGKLT